MPPDLNSRLAAIEATDKETSMSERDMNTRFAAHQGAPWWPAYIAYAPETTTIAAHPWLWHGNTRFGDTETHAVLRDAMLRELVRRKGEVVVAVRDERADDDFFGYSVLMRDDDCRSHDGPTIADAILAAIEATDKETNDAG